VQAIKGIPQEEVQLATKFGSVISADGQFCRRGDPEWVRESCEGSLKRLGVDYIDLYYQHCLDPTVPIEITVRNMQLTVPPDPSFLAQFSIQEIQLPGQFKLRCYSCTSWLATSSLSTILWGEDQTWANGGNLNEIIMLHRWGR
jgi:hypothetical protein